MLPTPTARLGDESGRGADPARYKGPKSQDGRRSNLDDCIAAIEAESPWLMPTPTGRDHKGRNQRDDATCLPGAVALLPTPNATVAQDGERPETWLARREVVKAKRINGNGMGMPLTIAVQLLPTPTSMDSKASGGSTPSDVTLTDAVVRTSLGARTNPRFGDGNTPSDGPPPGQLTIGDA